MLGLEFQDIPWNAGSTGIDIATKECYEKSGVSEDREYSNHK